MIQLVLFCFSIFIVYGAFGTKLLKGQLYYCTALDPELLKNVTNKSNCMDVGGSWVNRIFSYDTIAESIC
jgi:hypothetical protein